MTRHQARASNLQTPDIPSDSELAREPDQTRQGKRRSVVERKLSQPFTPSVVPLSPPSRPPLFRRQETASCLSPVLLPVLAWDVLRLLTFTPEIRPPAVKHS